jgi:hypothetical protein
MSRKDGKGVSWYSPPKKGGVVAVEGQLGNCPDITAECPCLAACLTGDGDPAKGGRPPCKIAVLADEGVLKVSIQDAYNSRTAYVTIGGGGTLGEIIERVLESGELDWRAWGSRKTRGG